MDTRNHPESRGSTSSGDAASQNSQLGSPTDSAKDHASADDASTIWDCLFDAVTERLRNTVSAAFSARQGSESRDAAPQIQAAVLECVEALDQLHEAVTLERATSKQQERQLRIAQRSASESHLQLAAAHAAEMLARSQARGVADYLQSDIR